MLPIGLVQAVRNASLWPPSSRCTAYPLLTWQQNTSPLEAVSSRHDKDIRHVINDRMTLLYRSFLLARLPTAHGLDTWSRLSQQVWLQPSFLAIARPLFTRYRLQITPIQCLLSLKSRRGFQSQPFSREGARYSLFTRPRTHWIHVRRFSPAPASTQAKNTEPLRHTENLPRLQQDLPLLLKGQLFPHQVPAAAKHTGPVGASRPNSQGLPTSKKPTSPGAEIGRSAMCYVICISIMVLIARSFPELQSPASQPIRAHEPCKDEKCGHELCQQLQISVRLSRGRF